MLSPLIFISVAQALFQNKLLQEVAVNVPEVNPAAVVAAGAAGLREKFAAHLRPILEAYLSGLKDAYILAITLGGIAFIVAVATIVFDNRNLKAKAPESVQEDVEAAKTAPNTKEAAKDGEIV